MVNSISIRSSSPSQQSIGSLSPSSISNSSSYNANNTTSNLLASSSPNTTSYVTTSQQTAQQTQTTSGSVISRNNYLISIKTTNGKSQGQGGQSKILKLTTNGTGGTVDGIVVDNGECFNLKLLVQGSSTTFLYKPLCRWCFLFFYLLLKFHATSQQPTFDVFVIWKFESYLMD